MVSACRDPMICDKPSPDHALRIQARTTHTLKTSFGSIDAANINGDATVTNSNASIRLSTVTGRAEVRGSFGSIEVTGVRQGARIISGNGSVMATDIGGETYVKTSFGLARAERIEGSLTVENSNGGVRALNVKGSASARTSFSSVVLQDVGGSVDVDNQNGAVEVSGVMVKSGARCNAFVVRTSFAPIRIFLPEDAGLTLAARTSFGRITSELPIVVTAALTSDSLIGKLGNGECEVRLTNSNGGIEIRKALGK